MNPRNQVQLIGHLGQDVEMRTFEGGRQLATVSLATNSSYHISLQIAPLFLTLAACFCGKTQQIGGIIGKAKKMINYILEIQEKS